MTPWKPPPPVPRKRPFQIVLGSQTSILMAESLIGVSVAVTRQNGGSPVSGAPPGGTNVPVSLSAADVMVACCSGRLARLVQGVAAAGAAPNAATAISATAKLTSRRR